MTHLMGQGIVLFREGYNFVQGSQNLKIQKKDYFVVSGLFTPSPGIRPIVNLSSKIVGMKSFSL